MRHTAASCACSTPIARNTASSRSSCSTATGVSYRRSSPARRLSGKEVRPFLRRLLRAFRANWPRTEILLRGDSHYCSPQVLDWCRAEGLDFIFGVAPTSTLRQHIEGLEASAKARFEAAPEGGKVRCFNEFLHGAKSWSRVERIIARVEVGTEGPDSRFIVTNLTTRNARVLFLRLALTRVPRLVT
jgi:hypothetical protein